MLGRTVCLYGSLKTDMIVRIVRIVRMGRVGRVGRRNYSKALVPTEYEQVQDSFV